MMVAALAAKWFKVSLLTFHPDVIGFKQKNTFILHTQALPTFPSVCLWVRDSTFCTILSHLLKQWSTKPLRSTLTNGNIIIEFHVYSFWFYLVLIAPALPRQTSAMLLKTHLGILQISLRCSLSSPRRVWEDWINTHRKSKGTRRTLGTLYNDTPTHQRKNPPTQSRLR